MCGGVGVWGRGSVWEYGEEKLEPLIASPVRMLKLYHF